MASFGAPSGFPPPPNGPQPAQNARNPYYPPDANGTQGNFYNQNYLPFAYNQNLPPLDPSATSLYQPLMPSQWNPLTAGSFQPTFAQTAMPPSQSHAATNNFRPQLGVDTANAGWTNTEDMPSAEPMTTRSGASEDGEISEGEEAAQPVPVATPQSQRRARQPTLNPGLSDTRRGGDSYRPGLDRRESVPTGPRADRRGLDSRRSSYYTERDRRSPLHRGDSLRQSNNSSPFQRAADRERDRDQDPVRSHQNGNTTPKPTPVAPKNKVPEKKPPRKGPPPQFARQHEEAKDFLSIVTRLGVIGFNDLVKDGFDPTKLREIFEEIGLEVPPATSAPCAPAPLGEQPKTQPESQPTPTGKPAVPVKVASTDKTVPSTAPKKQSQLRTTVATSDANATERKLSKAGEVRSAHDRSDYLARLKALQSGRGPKSATATTNGTDGAAQPTTPAQKAPEPSAPTNLKSAEVPTSLSQALPDATGAQTTSGTVTQSMGAREVSTTPSMSAADEKRRLQTELARQRIEALKKTAFSKTATPESAPVAKDSNAESVQSSAAVQLPGLQQAFEHVQPQKQGDLEGETKAVTALAENSIAGPTPLASTSSGAATQPEQRTVSVTLASSNDASGPSQASSTKQMLSGIPGLFLASDATSIKSNKVEQHPLAAAPESSLQRISPDLQSNGAGTAGESVSFTPDLGSYPLPKHQAHGHQSRKRPVASDFGDFDSTKPARPVKRRFGQAVHDADEGPMIIEVSDDETVESVMDRDEFGDVTTVSEMGQRGQSSSTEQAAGPAMMPGHDGHSLEGSSAFARPNDQLISSSLTPSGPQTPRAAEFLIQQRDLHDKIAKMKERIAKKMAANQPSRSQTPATPSEPAKTLAAVPSTAAPVVTDSSSADPVATLSHGQEDVPAMPTAAPSQESTVQPPAQTVKAKTPGPAELPTSWRRQRRVEIESQIPTVDADLASNRAKVEQLKQEMARLEAEHEQRMRDKEQLRHELESLGIDTEGMPHAEMQAVRDDIVQQIQDRDSRLGAEQAVSETENVSVSQAVASSADNPSTPAFAEDVTSTEARSLAAIDIDAPMPDDRTTLEVEDPVAKRNRLIGEKLDRLRAMQQRQREQEQREQEKALEEDPMDISEDESAESSESESAESPHASPQGVSLHSVAAASGQDPEPDSSEDLYGSEPNGATSADQQTRSTSEDNPQGSIPDVSIGGVDGYAMMGATSQTDAPSDGLEDDYEPPDANSFEPSQDVRSQPTPFEKFDEDEYEPPDASAELPGAMESPSDSIAEVYEQGEETIHVQPSTTETDMEPSPPEDMDDVYEPPEASAIGDSNQRGGQSPIPFGENKALTTSAEPGDEEPLSAPAAEENPSSADAMDVEEPPVATHSAQISTNDELSTGGPEADGSISMEDSEDEGEIRSGNEVHPIQDQLDAGVVSAQPEEDLSMTDSLGAATDTTTARLLHSTVIPEPVRPQPGSFMPYESPLKMFKAYRYHRQYASDVPGGVRSLTFSNHIDPNVPVCRFEALGGTCNDSQCEEQHFRNMGLSDDMILVELGTTNPGRAEDEPQWKEGLRGVLKDLRQKGVKDPDTVAGAISDYRRNFLKDPTKVLNL